MGFLRNLAAGGFSNASAIPGARSTQIKIKSPTQAETIAAGAKAYSPTDAARFADKDYRNRLAYEEVMVAQNLLRQAGQDANLFDAIDALNQPGARRGPGMVDALRNDEMVQNILAHNEQGGFNRGAPPSDFIGEGMFGQVRQLAPGYVVKNQAPVVEWPPMQYDDAGNQVGGYLHDARDVAQEVNVHNHLEKLGISPKIEAFNVDPSGASEVIMKDLRDNYDFGEKVNSDIMSGMDSDSPKTAESATKRGRKLGIKQAQQEAAAAMRGVELLDRHQGNIVYHKMMDRPLQIDLGINNPVQGFDRDAVMAQKAVQGMQMAGLDEEAGILDGLLRDALAKGDNEAFHDYAQQGVSRLMKLKGPVRDVRMAGDVF